MTWVNVDGKFNKRDIKIYSLSYCHACDKAKNYLKEKKITFRYLDIDLADSEERTEAAGLFGMDIPEGGISIAFPIILIDGKRIMGFDREKIANALEEEIGG